MCGIVGIVATQSVNQSLYDALTVLQHRGQDAAGIVTVDKDQFLLRKNNGLVRDVFHTRHMKKLLGQSGIGHVRYPTAGSADVSEAQPLYVNSPYGIFLAHNGNLTNAQTLRQSLFEKGRRHLNTSSDSEVLLNLFAYYLDRSDKYPMTATEIFNAIRLLFQEVSGAYSVVSLIIGHGLVAFRDPNGIRPLCLGRRVVAEINNNQQMMTTEIENISDSDIPSSSLADSKTTKFKVEYMVASESVALDAVGFEFVRDVAPGEVIYITFDGQFFSQQCADNPQLVPCLFEYVYFARPDSFLDGISVYAARVRMGEVLGNYIKKEWAHLDIDVVVPIPETSCDSALQIASVLNKPYRQGFVKNRYIGRTFIMPEQQARQKSVRRKLNAIKAEFKNKNVLLVDDSIVRGTTSQQIIEMAREAGANKVYLASAAPEIRYPNIYGIDMPSFNELVAYNRSIEDIRKLIGADALIFQRLDDLQQAVMQDNLTIKRFDASVFNGDYITNDSDQYFASLIKD